MRHPGFGLQPDVDVPDAVLHYLAAQLFVDVDAFADYGQRAQTRNDHADIAARHLGLHPFQRGDIPLALDLAARAAARTDRGEPIVRALMEGLKPERFILPSADTLARAGLAVRARPRTAAAALSLQRTGNADQARIAGLLFHTSEPTKL